MSHTRAQEIASPNGAAARRVSDRDRAYVCHMYRDFSGREFSHKDIANRRLAPDLIRRFNVKSDRLDDRTVLGRRLPDHGLLKHKQISIYQLTEAGVELAKQLDADANAE